MPLIVFILALAAVFFLALVMPLSLVQRYRVGTSRRLARGWLVTLNLVMFVVSTGLFLVAAAVTSVWVPNALTYTIVGLLTGGLLGLLGLSLSRWEPTPRSLHYTPNRWLVLGITVVVTLRLLYGIWRGWHVWRTSTDDTSWLAAAGAAGSLGIGAVVLGYYLAYWFGVRRRLNRLPLRVIDVPKR